METFAPIFLWFVGITTALDAVAVVFMHYIYNQKIKAASLKIEHQTFRRLFIEKAVNPFTFRRFLLRGTIATAYIASLITVLN